VKPLLTYYNIADDVTAFSTTRHGGESKGSYGSMNINSYCGDTPQAIAANRRLLAVELNVKEEHIVVPHQVHDVVCKEIADGFFNLPPSEQTDFLDGVDAVMTQCRDLCIGVSTADCIPVLLYDKRNRAVAAVHAGWRGTVRYIVHKSVEAMKQAFGTLPENIMAVIGPGITLRNFEVGQEVYDAFAASGHDMNAIAEKYEKWHLNLPLANRLQLECAGVQPANITMTDVCTYDATDDYFSARRLGIASGRIYTGIILR
jgi:YfiH family protein